MPVSVTLATILGPVLIVSGIGILLDRDSYVSMVREVLASPAWRYFVGLAALVAGLAMVLWHNVWVWDWPVMLTLFGWGGIVKGTALMLTPRWILQLVQPYQEWEWLMSAHAVVILAIGVFLTGLGLTAGSVIAPVK